MLNKMLIDASHPEETRVVVLRGNRVEEFDFEAANKKQLRGNIYLAKVTRVEPSLQAAFVDYGGNRHGFLAFSEIHPDYYQIPIADRQALLEEEARASRDEEDEERGGGRRSRRRRASAPEPAEMRSQSADQTISEPAGDAGASSPTDHVIVPEASHGEDGATLLARETAIAPEPESRESEAAAPSPGGDSPERDERGEQNAGDAEGADEDQSGGHEEITTLADGLESVRDEPRQRAGDDLENGQRIEQRHAPQGPARMRESEDEDSGVEQVGGDAMEDIPARHARSRRHYKIQEVIKRRQVLLVQVVKEERGTKGAALTTYLSLAGRYSVLMPNTARGGGISRKITNALDRKRLKSIAQELEVPDGMGVILRTAGASRTKAEVKRDFEYLLRMWETVRELTLKSTAPKLVYEEGSLIKRAIRDLYNKDIDEVLVAGDEGYREAKEFMRMLMPSHAKNVQPYRDAQPIFAKAGAEAQLDAMFSNQVTLRSGGYIVINQTEALVAIDVNSGRSTREHNIEDTALRTNLEAADEVARQLRLRDLAGLIVVDFIDMEENRNNRAVERRMKDALKNDRARIQIGRISHFGLLEMSRQRMRTGVLEGSTVVCPHCAGAGMVRSTSSIALHVLRHLEDALIKSAAHNMTVRTRAEVALYILNQKRPHLHELEKRFGVTVTVAADPTLAGTNYHTLERGELAAQAPDLRPGSEPMRPDALIVADEESALDEALEESDETAVETREDGRSREARSDEAGRDRGQEPQAGERGDDEGDGARRRRRRRRRRGRGGDRDGNFSVSAEGPQPSDAGLAAAAVIGGDMAGAMASRGADAEHRLDRYGEQEVLTGDATTSAESAQELAQAPPAKRRSRRGGRRSRRDGAGPEPRSADERESVTDEAGQEAPEQEKQASARRSRRPFHEAAPNENIDAGEQAAPVPSDPPHGEASPLREQGSMQATALLEPATPAASPEDPNYGEAEPASERSDMRNSETDRAAETGFSTPVDQSEAPERKDQEGAEPTSPEPPRPKRSGWWQRAKATLTGE